MDINQKGKCGFVFEGEFERTLDGIVARFTDAMERAIEVKVWSFDDVISRHAAEEKLAQLELNARLRRRI